MLRRKILSGLLVVAACLFLSMPVQATPPPLSLTVGEWKNFSFDDYSWLDLFAVSLDKPGLLTVTDIQAPGDRFEVWVFDTDSGFFYLPSEYQTSEPKESADFTLDPDVAVDPYSPWSSGVWNLARGNYQISGRVLNKIEEGQGIGYLRVSAVPVPAAAWLLGAALVGVVGLRRARKN
jgi:hypothetical protein